MTNTIDADLTADYVQRPVDMRMIKIINKYLLGYESVIDIASGAGQYGSALAKNNTYVYGIDYDEILCSQAVRAGGYTDVFCAPVQEIKSYIRSVEAIFCSEFLEHLSNNELPKIMRLLESITNKTLVITVPNPISPHFKYDPTHILKYNVRSLLNILNKSDKFTYKMYALGFSQFNLQNPIFKAANILSKSNAFLSPTVLYIGSIINQNQHVKK